MTVSNCTRCGGTGRRRVPDLTDDNYGQALVDIDCACRAQHPIDEETSMDQQPEGPQPANHVPGTIGSKPERDLVETVLDLHERIDHLWEEYDNALNAEEVIAVLDLASVFTQWSYDQIVLLKQMETKPQSQFLYLLTVGVQSDASIPLHHSVHRTFDAAKTYYGRYLNGWARGLTWTDWDDEDQSARIANATEFGRDPATIQRLQVED